MLSLRDPSPRIAQATQSLFTPPSSPNICKDEPLSPRIRLLSPIQNAIPDILTLKSEDDTMQQPDDAGGSASGSNNHPRRPNPQQEADAELAHLLQQQLARAAGAAANAPGPASAQSRLPPLTLQGFGVPPVRAPQQGFPEQPFSTIPYPPIPNWSAYDPQAHAQLEHFLRQATAQANQQNAFFPLPPLASPLTPATQHSPTAPRTSRASSGLSGNDSPVPETPSGQGAQRPRTQAEIDAAMIAEEKRRRNTDASARFRIKKKQRMVNLDRSLSDLQRRADDLEREASDLRRENTWLKEMVLMKGRRRVGKSRALEETPAPASSKKAKGKRKGPAVEQDEDEEDEEGDYISEDEEEEGSEEDDEA